MHWPWVKFGAAALIYANTSVSLSTIAFATSVHISTQWK